MEVPQVRVEGDIWSGFSATGTIPERFTSRGLDRLGELAFITKGTNKFMFSVHTRFGKAKSVPNREHMVTELAELDRRFFVTGTSDSVNGRIHNRIPISNLQAAQLQLNDMLINTKLYAYVKGVPTGATQMSQTSVNSNGTYNSNPVNIGPALGYTTGYMPTSVAFSRLWGKGASNEYFVDYEPMKVVHISEPNAISSGISYIVVNRCYTGPHSRDMGGSMIPTDIIDTSITADLTNGVIKEGDMLLRMLPVFKEGTGAPNGLHKNPVIDNNFTQEFKYAVEKTAESDINKNLLSKTPFEINKMLTTRRMNMDIERTYLFGRKGKSMDQNGKVEYLMGGVVESIIKDDAHIIEYKQPALTYQGLLDLGRPIFELGGSQERDMFVGYSLYTELKKAFYASGYLRTDASASANFDIEIESIITAGGKLNIIPLSTMEEAGWGMRALCLDMSVPAFTPVTHDGWDMRYEPDIQEKGTNMKKDQIIGIKGLERKYLEYQSIVNFDL